MPVARFQLQDGRIGRFEVPDGTTPEQAQSVQTYVNNVRSIVNATEGILLVEQRLPIEHMTGEDGATGTADAVILTPDEFTLDWHNNNPGLTQALAH